MSKDKQARINSDISSKTVLLINENGKNVGNVSLPQALNVASSAGLDLVEVGHRGNVSVCRVMDYGKWRYEQSKRTKRNKNQSSKQVNKEIKLRPNTGENDLVYRANQIGKFVGDSSNVKICVRFKGREVEHMYQTGQALLEKFLSLIPVSYKMIGTAKVEGRNIIQWIGPNE